MFLSANQYCQYLVYMSKADGMYRDKHYGKIPRRKWPCMSSSDLMCVIQVCRSSSLSVWQTSAKSAPGDLSVSVNLKCSSSLTSSVSFMLFT